jgi:hypothetical protein
VSTTVGVALLVGLTVMSSVVLVGAVAVAPVEPPPAAAVVTDGAMEADEPGDDDQQVCLQNRGPEPLRIDAVQIRIRIPDAGRETTLVGLPPDWPALPEEGYRGDDLVDRRSYKFSGVFGPSDGDTPRWEATERGCLRIKHGGDGVRLDPGDRVTVTVVHQPTNGIVDRVALRAR